MGPIKTFLRSKRDIKIVFKKIICFRKTLESSEKTKLRPMILAGPQKAMKSRSYIFTRVPSKKWYKSDTLHGNINGTAGAGAVKYNSHASTLPRTATFLVELANRNQVFRSN